MQTRKINKEFFKKNNLTLSHLNEILNEQVIKENKFKSVLAALLLGLMPSTKAGSLTTNSKTVQNITKPLLNLIDRSGNASQILLRRKNPNPAEIANIKVKIDADLNNLFNDTLGSKLSDVNVDQYFSMIMAAHRLTEKDTEYETIKSIAEKLPKEFAMFTMFGIMGGGGDIQTSLANVPKLVKLYYYQTLVSK
jgi:hypothetical protein